MAQLHKLKAILALLYEIAELERAPTPDHAKIDRLKAKLRDLLAEDGDRGERSQPPDPPAALPNE
jgi:hypothetical protein